MPPARGLRDPAADAALGEEAVGAVERRQVVLHQEALAVRGPGVRVHEEAVRLEVASPEVLDPQAVDVGGVDAVLGDLVGPVELRVIALEDGVAGIAARADEAEPVVAVAGQGDALLVGAGTDLDHRVGAVIDRLDRRGDGAVLAAVLADGVDLLILADRGRHTHRQRNSDHRHERPHPQPHASPSHAAAVRLRGSSVATKGSLYSPALRPFRAPSALSLEESPARRLAGDPPVSPGVSVRSNLTSACEPSRPSASPRGGSCR